MDVSLLLQAVALLVALGALVLAYSWLRHAQGALAQHQAALAEAARANAQAARALEAALEAVQLTRHALEAAPRQATFPQLYCDVVRRDGRSQLVLSNPGSVPAVRVAVLAAAQYAGETPLAAFLETYVQKEEVDAWVQSHGVEPAAHNDAPFGVVYERAYPLFPAGRKVTYALNLPVLPRMIFVLLQFESILGENYLNLYRFSTEEVPERVWQTHHRLTARTPEIARPSPRVGSLEWNGRYLIFPDEDGAEPASPSADGTDGGGLPASVRDALFLETLKYAMPARYLKREHAASQNREVWMDVTA